ncbi:MAG: STAS domain-containing protein [Candidatus Omnitrophota bacterium]
MVQFTEENGKLICSFSRRLDSANCAKWEEWLYKKVEGSKTPVVFDMKDVDYIASGFLRICIKVLKEIGEDNLSVINAHQNVKKIFKLAGIDRIITVK